MRKVIVFNLITLDGYFAGEDGNIDWHHVDAEFNDFAVEQTRTFSTIIFGLTTYKIFEEFWPKAVHDPKMSKEDREIAKIIDDAPKIVFSKSLKKVTWKNTTLLHEIDPKEIEKLKSEKGGDIFILGSGTVVKAMTELNLIDEYRLLINPVILGKGKSMFEGLKKKLELTLIDTRPFKNGNVLVTYVPKH